jgi:hypothetical protein
MHRWRVHAVLDGAPVVLDVVAEDEDDAKRVIAYQHDRQVYAVYAPIPGVEVQIHWNLVLDLEFGRVDQLADLKRPSYDPGGSRPDADTTP